MQRNPKAVRMETVTRWAGYLRNNTRQQLDALHFVPDDIGKSIECEIPAEQSNALRMVCATFRWVDFLTARPMTARRRLDESLIESSVPFQPVVPPVSNSAYTSCAYLKGIHRSLDPEKCASYSPNLNMGVHHGSRGAGFGTL